METHPTTKPCGFVVGRNAHPIIQAYGLAVGRRPTLQLNSSLRAVPKARRGNLLKQFLNERQASLKTVSG
ncbi:MAG: hypothetical protein IJV35_06935 [Neisseriaceae bacterium]|nr:hypothetical protein [Neisseriaceae bacterium]